MGPTGWSLPKTDAGRLVVAGIGTHWCGSPGGGCLFEGIGTQNKLQIPYSVLPQPSLTILNGLQPPVFEVWSTAYWYYCCNRGSTGIIFQLSWYNYNNYSPTGKALCYSLPNESLDLIDSHSSRGPFCSWSRVSAPPPGCGSQWVTGITPGICIMWPSLHRVRCSAKCFSFFSPHFQENTKER